MPDETKFKCTLIAASALECVGGFTKRKLYFQGHISVMTTSSSSSLLLFYSILFYFILRKNNIVHFFAPSGLNDNPEWTKQSFVQSGTLKVYGFSPLAV